MGFIAKLKSKLQSLKRPQLMQGEVFPETESTKDLGSLILEFEALCLRMEILKDDQAELIQCLDDGKITAILFRKEMAEYAQEVVLVTSKLELAKMQLADFGYRDIWV